MAKMHVIDSVQVTRNKMIEKRFPQGGGGGGQVDFRGRNGEKGAKNRGQELGVRGVRTGRIPDRLDRFPLDVFWRSTMV